MLPRNAERDGITGSEPMSSAALKDRKLHACGDDQIRDALPTKAVGTADAGGMDRVVTIQSSADNLIHPRRRIIRGHQAAGAVLEQVAVVDGSKPTKSKTGRE